MSPRTVPFYLQDNAYFCGPAVIQMVLASFGIKRSQAQLAKKARTNDETGTTTRALIRTLRAEGLLVSGSDHSTTDQPRRALTAGRVVIVCFMDPDDEVGHYAVV